MLIMICNLLVFVVKHVSRSLSRDPVVFRSAPRPVRVKHENEKCFRRSRGPTIERTLILALIFAIIIHGFVVENKILFPPLYA